MEDVFYLLNSFFGMGYMLAGGYFAFYRNRYDIGAFFIAGACFFKLLNIGLEINP